MDMQSRFYEQGRLGTGLMYFLLTALMMVGSPSLYHHGLRRRFEKQAWYQEKLTELSTRATQQEYLIVYRYLQKHGHFPDDIPRLMAVAMLFLILLFDLFFLSAWVDKNGVMVWQPEWVKGVIKWVTESVNVRQFPYLRLYDIPNLLGKAKNQAVMV